MAEILSEAQESSKGEKISEIIGEVEFQSVSFGYKEDEQHALHNVSFQVKPGEKLAIIGPTGSGKSTLVKLLLRLYEPSEGIILLDGKPLAEYAATAVRHKIGLALQKPFLFSTTIRGNIAYTQPEADFEYVLEAAKIAQIQEVRNTFPEGFETRVGEKGVTLSGGQKQRVALARTILVNPKILIMDEATSSVDTLAELAIQQGIDQMIQERTAIIIAHRLSTIKNCDRILVVEHGKIIEDGSHASLIAAKGHYYDLCMKQARKA
ncbi:UNVERIFIED_CONTAM: hypothetical protein GTU68_057730 [Idotea baltica]|nr:hypothetical protein [Idotea baltica]